MKTDDLVSLLASGATPVPPHAVARRMGLAIGLGAIGAALVMALALGVRPDLVQALRMPMFWVKLLFPASLALLAFLAAERLARPGMRLGALRFGLFAPVLTLWMLGAVVFMEASPTQRATLLMGSTWRSCPFNIAMISVPLAAASLWAMKGLAPTRPALAGAGAGLLAGALAALLYALHCTEMAAPFLGLWYVVGIAIPTLAGALLGPRLLRW